MSDYLITQYNKITKLIDEQNKRYDDYTFSKLIASFGDGEKSEKDDDSLVYRNHCFFQLSYTCLRTEICCRIIDAGSRKFANELEDNIKQVIENVKQVKYEWEISDELLRDSLDVLLLLCKDYKDIIVPYFPKSQVLFKSGRSEVSSDLFYIAVNVMDCLKKNGDSELAINVVEQLCKMSRERNKSERHRYLIVNVLPRIIDDESETAYAICCDNASFFDDELSLQAGDFFWYYSYSAHVLEQTDDAIKYLEKCILIRKTLIGDNNWYTVTAECELVLRTMKSTREIGTREYFIKFIDDVEHQKYENIDPDYAIMMEGRCVFSLLHNDPDMDSIAQYRYYVDLFERLCNQPTIYPLPFLTPRMGKNMRGTICLRTGDYIGAEKYFTEALEFDSETDPSGTILSDAQLKSNLLMAYFNQNDLENVSLLLDELLEIIDDEEDDSLSETDVYRIYGILVSTYSFFELDDKAIENILELVREECDSIVTGNNSLSEGNKEQATFICSAISILVQKQVLSRADYWAFYKALNKIKQFANNMLLEKRRIVALNYILALLAYNLDLPSTGFYMRESLIDLYHNGISSGIRAAVLSLVAIYYARNNQFEQAKEYLNDTCAELDKEWKQSIRYLNDTRLMNVLTVAQLQYLTVYAVQRQICDIKSSYNSIIQFKALASLAGKERNRVINSGMIDPELMERIHMQQNIVAQLESDSIDHIDEAVLSNAYDEMRILETEFSERFPGLKEFKEISLERIVKAMPDNSVIVEYFDTSPYYGLGAFETIAVEEAQSIDAFVLRKIKGTCTLYKYVVEKGATVLNKAEEFVKIYEALSSESATTEQLNEQELIRHILYKELIAPIEKYMQGADTVYIAPSGELINLPFGLLKEEGREKLFQEDHFIIMIECARDFLFTSSGANVTDKALVIGDPEYNIKEKTIEDIENRPDEQRSFTFNDFTISPLPFSGIEAIRISNHISADCRIGMNANKKVLLSAMNYKNIHLATHGFVDYESSTDTLYSTCLLLTGAQNWLTSGEIDKKFGNGIVTADEISRLEWKNVELVVLSTCMSGMNDFTINKGFNGMVSALSAAGVKYVICSLWNQSDFGTAIMMEEFYRLYQQEGKTPFEALREAQIYLKNVTIRELKDRGWLNITDIRVKEVIDQYRKMNDRRRPFRNEVYWGGFECFRCN